MLFQKVLHKYGCLILRPTWVPEDNQELKRYSSEVLCAYVHELH